MVVSFAEFQVDKLYGFCFFVIDDQVGHLHVPMTNFESVENQIGLGDISQNERDFMWLNFGEVIKEGADCFFHDDPEASLSLDEFDKVTDGVAVEHVQEVALKDDLMLFLIDDELADE